MRLRAPRFVTCLPAAALAVALVSFESASAQSLPSGPITVGGGRLVLGGEVSLTGASQKDEGFFNYTDYEYNLLRTVRLGLSGALRLSGRASLLGELRTDNAANFRAHALYLRLRPWPQRAFDIQAGRVPPVFGAFGRRAYGDEHPLIGYPLAYQYLTSLRVDAVPATTDDTLRMRGRGWLADYPIGSQTPAPGLPLVNALRWGSGIQVRAGGQPVELAAALTFGSLSQPLLPERDGRLQVAGRMAWRPAMGLVAGFSGATGLYLSQEVAAALPPALADRRFGQRAAGVDLEYSRGHWLLRAEGVFRRWEVPAIAEPRHPGSLDALGLMGEGRYRLTGRTYVAGRVDRLTFSRLRGTLFGGRATPWDAPVARIEGGAGYRLHRNVRAKLAWQFNWRDGGRQRRFGVLAGQLVYRF
jgi:hypothetical protein